MRHERVFAIRHDDLLRVFEESIPDALREMSRLFRPLRLGWMCRRGILPIRGVVPTSDEHMRTITRLNRGKRHTLDPDKYLAGLTIPETYDEILDWPDGPFGLYKGGRLHHPNLIGVGFKFTQGDDVELLWTSPRWAFSDSSGFADRILTQFRKYDLVRSGGKPSD